jgi:hypothetical protein
LPDFGNCRNRQQPISMGASRRMAASHCRASILRDAVLRTAPQDEVLISSRALFAGDDTAA